MIVVPRARPIFDEGGAKGPAVEIGVELVGAEEGEAVAVVDGEAVGEVADVVADVDVPLPVGEEVADSCAVSPLIGSSTRVRCSVPLNFTRTPFRPSLAERRVERQRGEIALAGAEVARRVEALVRIIGSQIRTRSWSMLTRS